MIAIVVDSTAYMTAKEAQALGVRNAPNSYSFNGRSYSEGFIDDDDQFSALLAEREADCVTFKPEVSVFSAVFRELTEKGFDVLCLTISSRMSSTWKNALAVAKSINPEKIRVFDSLLTAGGLYILVKKARALAAAGLGIDEIFAELENLRDRIHIQFSVDDLTHIKNSKRLGLVRKAAATILNRRPIFHCVGGSIVLETAARGEYDQIRKLSDGIPPDVDHIIVHYAKKSETVSNLIKYLKQKHPGAVIEPRPIGPVIAINIGFNMSGVVWCEKALPHK